jgi:hypothetical protein
MHGQMADSETLISFSTVLSRSVFREFNSISSETLIYCKYVFENCNNVLISFSETTEYTFFTDCRNVQNISFILNLNLRVLRSFRLVSSS